MKPSLFSTKKIPVQGLDIHWVKRGEELGLTGEVKAITPVRVEGQIIAQGSIFIFSGTVSTLLEVDCARCLNKFELPIEETFKINYEPAIYETAAPHNDLELGREDFDVTYYENDLLPLDDDLREAILLAIPAVPLCAESCLGLCPQCGRDRNKEECKCESGNIDHRWEGLAALKKKMEER